MAYYCSSSIYFYTKGEQLTILHDSEYKISGSGFGLRKTSNNDPLIIRRKFPRELDIPF